MIRRSETVGSVEVASAAGEDAGVSRTGVSALHKPESGEDEGKFTAEEAEVAREHARFAVEKGAKLSRRTACMAGGRSEVT